MVTAPEDIENDLKLTRISSTESRVLIWRVVTVDYAIASTERRQTVPRVILASKSVVIVALVTGKYVVESCIGWVVNLTIRRKTTYWCSHLCCASYNIRAVASITVPGGQEFHFPHFFLKFWLIFLTFPQNFLIFFLILALRVGNSPTREGPGYATV